jgi:23S rRNA (pseudouridine1915-N3)-methyltransferase
VTNIFQVAVMPERSGPRSEPAGRLVADYIARTSRYLPCETQLFSSESDLLQWLDRQAARTPAHLVLLDSRGKQLSSEELAESIGRLRDSGTQRLVFAIGPADGWSDAARARANLLLSFGRITLPHQLARVVLAEQVYRAFTILAGHPYHSGH